MEQAVQEILMEMEKRNVSSVKDLKKIKSEISRKYKLKKEPKIIHLEIGASEEQRRRFKDILVSKPVRTGSGVAPLALFSMPANCPPQAKCIFCPGGPGSVFGNVPKSYTGNEPASRRAARNKYDPYLQVFNRLEHYALLNQNFDKVDLIVMGGTFLFYSDHYKKKFITDIFMALNDFSDMFFVNGEFNFNKFKEFFELPAEDLNDINRTNRIHEKLLKIKKDSNLEFEKNKNETADVRCIGLTIETRPDLGYLKEGNEMLNYGATKVELGVQSVYDDDLEFVKRGHTVNDSIESIKILKDLGFKIMYHYMPGITQDRKKDLDGLKRLFSDQNFRPDMIKIYPCLVMPGTELYDLYKEGKFKPINTEEAAELICEVKKVVPEYCRINRVQRDIPTNVTVDGPDRTNLRQIIDKKCKVVGIKCRCIRCREIKNNEINNPELKILEYEASDGKEFFISFEENDKLIGFCRLRLPSQSLRREITKDTAIIRELHVYSSAVNIGGVGRVQHRGFGRMLMNKAEEIALENGKNKVLVISGVGVRRYYIDKLGYQRDGPYVSKLLSS